MSINATNPEPTAWGPWVLARESLELYAGQSPFGYGVDLERCLTSGEMLDWIMQVARKSWASHEMIGQLVEALNDLLNPQGTLCSFASQKAIPAEDVGALVRRNEIETRAHRLSESRKDEWAHTGPGGLRVYSGADILKEHARAIGEVRAEFEAVAS